MFGVQRLVPRNVITVAAATRNTGRIWCVGHASSRCRTRFVPPQCRSMSSSSSSTSHWSSYEMAPPDPIIGLNEAYQKDPHPDKVIVGVGAYRDDDGKPYVLPSVRIAEQRLMEQQLDMEYSGIVRTICCYKY